MEKYTGAPVESAGMECKRGMTKGYTKVFFGKRKPGEKQRRPLRQEVNWTHGFILQTDLCRMIENI